MSENFCTRKQFLIVLGGSSVLTAIGCSSDDPGSSTRNGSGGTAGAGGTTTTGSGGTTGTGATSSAGGTTGTTGGTGNATGGTSSAGGTTGSGGTTGTTGGTGNATGGSATGGSGGTGTGGTGAAECMTLTSEITCPHGHNLDMLTIDMVMAGVDVEVDIRGGGNHGHDVMFTAADFATLRSGGTVHKYVGSPNQPHCVSVSCALPGTPTPGVECAADAFECDE